MMTVLAIKVRRRFCLVATGLLGAAVPALYALPIDFPSHFRETR